MPAWFGKKSTKSKEQPNQHQEEAFHSSHIKFSKSSIKTDQKSRDNPKSFDDPSAVSVSHKSPRSSRDLGFSGGGAYGSSGFSGFDYDSSERKGHPLPQPAVSTTHNFVVDHGVGIGSGSVSVSSVSSSGSSDDHPIAQSHGCQFLAYRLPADSKMDPSTAWRNAIGTSDSPRTDSTTRSFGTGSRGLTCPSSPLNSRDDGKGQCHRLPLPPSSPTSPSALPNFRPVGAAENSPSQPCWKKGRLLGRGTFGHVYLGFNRLQSHYCFLGL